MAIGKVKWFNNAKGYGFILPESGNGDLFVHYSSIQMEGYKTLKAGQEVEFDTVAGPKGQHAVNIRRLSVDEDTELEAPPRTSEESPDRDEFPDQDELPDRDE